MFRKLFFWGLTAGILSAVASVIYHRIFGFAFTYEGLPDYSKVTNIPVLIGINLIAGMVAAAGCFLCLRLFKSKAELIFNLVFSLISFASIMYPISVRLPLDIQNPELFPLLTVPMHFFPVIAWMTIRPVFGPKVFVKG